MIAREAVDRLLQRSGEGGGVPGVVAMAASPQGVLYAGAGGFRRRGAGEPMTIDTIFRIASMTKAVTSVAAMQLVEQGTLALDVPAAAYAPRLAEVQVLEGFDETGTPRLRPPQRPLTLRHLLSHTSGFVYSIWNADAQRYERDQAARLVDDPRTPILRPLAFDPGERWEYGIGIDWAGHLVEIASGLSLEAYVQRYICGPLRMPDTTFVLRDEQLPRLAELHRYGDDGVLLAEPVTMPAPPTFYNGGGGLFSTAPDYLRFTRMVLRGGELDGERVLSQASVDALGRNQIGALRVTPFVTSAPGFSRSGELLPGVPKTWGLGYLRSEAAAPTGRSAGSVGWAGLFNTYYWIDPHRARAGVLMAQVLPFLDPQVLALLEAFEAAVYA
jgi:CubicO group peptidase (beta-lactamase class C family)